MKKLLLALVGVIFLWQYALSQPVPGVLPYTCPSHQWANNLSPTGVTSCAQPAPSDLSSTTGNGPAVLENSPTINTPVINQPVINTPTIIGGTITSLTINSPTLTGVTANPSATAGPAAVNGSATTFMRSDAAPAVQKATSSQFGIVQPDNSTIVLSAGNLAVTPTIVAGATCAAGSSCGLSMLTSSLSGDVALNNTSNYFDGPSVAQGTSGTWLVTGHVTLQDASNAPYVIEVKLWDGSTIIDSASLAGPAATTITTVPLIGVITNPAGNLRISARDTSSTSGKILFNTSGNSKDSTITVTRTN